MNKPLLKPKDQKKRRKPVDVFVKQGGREVCSKSRGGREEYRKRRQLAWERDKGVCILCERYLPLKIATTEHIETKGAGGFKHDDRLQNLAVSHLEGNMARGSMELALYLKKPLEERIRLCQ